MLLRELSNYAPSNADEASALVQVGSQQLPGYGGVAAPKPGYQDSPYENYPGPIGNGNGGNGNGAGTGPFDPRAAQNLFQVPNNFWGFVMLMMGLKS